MTLCHIFLVQRGLFDATLQYCLKFCYSRETWKVQTMTSYLIYEGSLKCSYDDVIFDIRGRLKSSYDDVISHIRGRLRKFMMMSYLIYVGNLERSDHIVISDIQGRLGKLIWWRHIKYTKDDWNVHMMTSYL